MDLIDDQLERPDQWRGSTFNIGGGVACSLSLVETTELCRELTGNEIELGRVAETRPGDVPVYLSDCRAVFGHSDWRPRRSREDVLGDIFAWVRENERTVEKALP